MSQLKLCQGPSCHTYRTKDRIRGSKGDKHYQTRKRSSFYFDLFCSQRCEHDWLKKFGNQAVDHFGRIHEPKRTSASGAWYKDSKYLGYNNDGTRYAHYFVNDLLGERRPITEQQYNDENFVSP